MAILSELSFSVQREGYGFTFSKHVRSAIIQAAAAFLSMHPRSIGSGGTHEWFLRSDFPG